MDLENKLRVALIRQIESWPLDTIAEPADMASDLLPTILETIKPEIPPESEIDKSVKTLEETFKSHPLLGEQRFAYLKLKFTHDGTQITCWEGNSHVKGKSIPLVLNEALRRRQFDVPQLTSDIPF